MFRILVVDDSSIVRNQIERFGAQSNLKVVGKASNGYEALDIYRDLRPDLVTMDLTMPEMDGLSCIRALINYDPDARILVISALADKYTAIEAIGYGARGFVHKPFTQDELKLAIEQVMATI